MGLSVVNRPIRPAGLSPALRAIALAAAPDRWQTGAGCGLTFTPRNKICRVVLRYGYGFNAIREDGDKGAHSVGLLVQYDFEQHKNWRRNSR